MHLLTPRKTAIVSLLGCLGAASLGAQARRIELTDLGRIARVSDAQLSPDGRTALVLVARPDYGEDRYKTDLVAVSTAGGQPHVLVADRRGLSSARWSPGGDRIAFLASETPSASGAATPPPQLWIMPAAGGEAKRITSAAGGVQHFAWRPNGSALAYVAADSVPQRTGEERFNDSFEVGNNDYLITTAPTPSHLWLVPSDGGSARRLTSGSWSLPTVRPPGAPPSPLTWSPDGRLLAFTRVPTPRSGDFGQSTLQLIDVETGAIRALTGGKAQEGFANFSPDGKRIAFSFPKDAERKNVNQIRVMSLTSGTPAVVTGDIDRNIARAIWMPDGNSLLVGANDSKQVAMWVQPIGGAARRIETGNVSPNSSFWVDMSVGPHGEIAFTGSEPGRPSELYFMTSPTAKVQRLTDYNHDVASLALGRTETIDWTQDGFQENGVVIYPPDFNPSRKYPLVLEVHGGPRAASLETFGARPQMMAAKGWIVFQPNYRGSDNLGSKFQAAIWNDAGAGPGRDVMAGVRKLIDRGIIDTTRIAVTGWSYGGYMSTWLAGRYPKVWRAAVIGAPVTNWLDQYTLGDANVRRADAFGGSPYTSLARMKAYLDQSPMAVAPNIRVPTLIMHDLRDDRVPVSQGYELYHALRDNGVETKFVVYPIAGHNAADPVRQRDVTRRWIDWVEQHFAERAAMTP
ncbi:MAG TPA: S9 family peptidase [Gemmatimonadaceae bacterium]|nr:S9 family peptidase [Gemmatimonadaceae bacterium]